MMIRASFILISFCLVTFLIGGGDGVAASVAGATPDTQTILAPGNIARVSVDSAGQEADQDSINPAISSDGHFVTFESSSSNLVPGDSNGYPDIFVRELEAGQTIRASVSTTGAEANGSSVTPVISADGRYVAFVSYADNLVVDDHNMNRDIFVHDRLLGVTERVNVSSDGKEAHDASGAPDISGDGRYVVFASQASNLVPDDTNGNQDIFVHDRETGITDRVSISTDGHEANGASYDPAISRDGGIIAFASSADNLVPDDHNQVHDVFIHDRRTGLTQRISVNSQGEAGNGPSQVPDLSDDGRYVSFYSRADNLVADDINQAFDVFVHDRLGRTTVRASVAVGGRNGDGDTFFHTISGDGRFIAFISYATNLVVDDGNGVLDVFIHNRETGETQRVSLGSGGQEGNGSHLLRYPSLSGDGRLVAFDSDANNLIADDSNDADDIFVRSMAWELTPSFRALLPVVRSR